MVRIFSQRINPYMTTLVFHASELPLLFGPVPTPVEEVFANQMLDFYIRFVSDLNPGGKLSRPLAISRGVVFTFEVYRRVADLQHEDQTGSATHA